MRVLEWRRGEKVRATKKLGCVELQRTFRLQDCQGRRFMYCLAAIEAMRSGQRYSGCQQMNNGCVQ